MQRRQPEKSGVQKLLGGVSSALPAAGKGRTKATASSGKAKKGGAVGGLALLAAAAGAAFKNRDKITSKLSGDHSNGARGSATSGTAESPVGGGGVADVPAPPPGATSAREPERSSTAGGPQHWPNDAGPAA